MYNYSSLEQIKCYRLSSKHVSGKYTKTNVDTRPKKFYKYKS